jgi:3-methyladenine DNA glycosylase/8-oxoguanine DNA glycosylase
MAVLELPAGYRADLTLRYLGRDGDSLCERVEGNVIVTADLRIEVAESPSRRAAKTNSETRGLGDSATLSTARKLLGLNLDPKPFESAHPQLVHGHEGAHLPQTATVWESVMWAIVGQQVNLPFAYRLRRVLVELCGEPAANGLRRHPTPERVAQLDYADLTVRQFSRSKAQYVIDTARLIASGALPVETFPSREPSEVEEMLLGVRGIGIWTANYVMMRGCAFPDCVPAGDSALSSSLRDFLRLDHRPDAHETRMLMERFAPWRTLATFHLWLRK